MRWVYRVMVLWLLFACAHQLKAIRIQLGAPNPLAFMCGKLGTGADTECR